MRQNLPVAAAGCERQEYRYLRAHADRFNIDPDRIGVMGESAGGYLTCMAALATDPVL